LTGRKLKPEAILPLLIYVPDYRVNSMMLQGQLTYWFYHFKPFGHSTAHREEERDTGTAERLAASHHA
jgi:hypothetical protein